MSPAATKETKANADKALAEAPLTGKEPDRIPTTKDPRELAATEEPKQKKGVEPMPETVAVQEIEAISHAQEVKERRGDRKLPDPQADAIAKSKPQKGLTDMPESVIVQEQEAIRAHEERERRLKAQQKLDEELERARTGTGTLVDPATGKLHPTPAHRSALPPADLDPVERDYGAEHGTKLDPATHTGKQGNKGAEPMTDAVAAQDAEAKAAAEAADKADKPKAESTDGSKSAQAQSKEADKAKADSAKGDTKATASK